MIANCDETHVAVSARSNGKLNVSHYGSNAGWRAF